MDKLDREYYAILRESRQGVFTSAGLPVEEAWSDAARAASVAARRAKARGHDWRKAGRTAFRRAVKQMQGFDVRDAFKTAAAQADTGSFAFLPRGATGAQAILRKARKKAEREKTDRAFWAARRAHISQALTHKGARFAYA